MPSVMSTPILFPFRTIAQHESGTRKKTISWSVTVYKKTLSSQCKLIVELDNRTVEISSLIDLFNLKYFE